MRKYPLHLILAATISVIAQACNIEVGDNITDAPSRPNAVPEDAIWSGGADGGVFILLSFSDESTPGTYRASIYNDQTGDLEFNGLLSVGNSSDLVLNPGDTSLFAGWDGSRLYLSDGRYLEVAKSKKN